MKGIIFIQIGTGVFAVEIAQIKRFITNVALDFSNKGAFSGIIGLFRFQDEVIPVLDLFRWFGQKQINICNETVFVIMMFGGKSFAFQISDVIKSDEVSNEYFHVLPDIFNRESAGAFREVIDWGGTLYPKICAETILKEMTTNTETIELWENR